MRSSLRTALLLSLVPLGAMAVYPARAAAASLEREIIRRVIRRHLSEIKTCFETSWAKDPEHEGRTERAVLRFTILADGHVSEAELAVPVTDASLHDCLVATALRMRFPSSPGKTTVTYPVIFRSEAAAISAVRLGHQAPRRRGAGAGHPGP